jgi:hypothetical protein
MAKSKAELLRMGGMLPPRVSSFITSRICASQRGPVRTLSCVHEWLPGARVSGDGERESAAGAREGRAGSQGDDEIALLGGGHDGGAALFAAEAVHVADLAVATVAVHAAARVEFGRARVAPDVRRRAGQARRVARECVISSCARRRARRGPHGDVGDVAQPRWVRDVELHRDLARHKAVRLRRHERSVPHCAERPVACKGSAHTCGSTTRSMLLKSAR